MYRHDSVFVTRMCDDIGALIVGEAVDPLNVRDRLCELAVTNSPVIAGYWAATERGRGIPDSAFKDSPPYVFPGQPAARIFRTSGTTGSPGYAAYSPRGLELMRLSILENARCHLLAGLDRPAVIRFVPPEDRAPEMVMAYGMQLIAETFGDAELSDVVVGAGGIDYARLDRVLERTIDAGVPALLIGASLAFVNVCDGLDRRGRSFELPHGSRVLDAGGFKGRARTVGVPELRTSLRRSFGIDDGKFVNLFGMTELASQLYDSIDNPVGPLGERPKRGTRFVEPRVLDPVTMEVVHGGQGLLEVLDLCLVDRPLGVLTGDLAIATGDGPAIVGRVERGRSRGCSLTLDERTAGEFAHA